MDPAPTTAELLASYGAILSTLRERGVIRTENSPVGDYAEYLAARAFGLTLADNSGIGWDGRDAAGIRYQIKGRRITARNGSRQLGAMRGLDGDPFDVLVGVLFDEQCVVIRAALIPIATVRTLARRSEYVNGSSIILRESVWLEPGVVDVTDRLRAAAEPVGSEAPMAILTAAQSSAPAPLIVTGFAATVPESNVNGGRYG